MVKKVLGITVLVLLVGFLLFGAVYRTLAKNADAGSQVGDPGGHRNGQEAVESTSLDTQRGGGGAGGCDENDQAAGKKDNSERSLERVDLTEAEIDGLLFMLEEEKLARDVYTAMYALWSEEEFLHISESEQKHMTAVAHILEHYELEAAVSDEAGVLVNADLQVLYNELVARGSQSLYEALLVGAAIEEIDILDLEQYLAQTTNPQIEHVYQNLLMGSQNHLRAFVDTLNKSFGETYQPRYLSAEAYEAALNSPTGREGRGGGGYRGGRP